MRKWILFFLFVFIALAWAADSLLVDPVSVSRGGLIYDKWWVVVGADAPETDHPLWSLQETNERMGADTWRCKECHGWDYLGADGAYGSGSHFTGFPGVLGTQSLDLEAIVAALSGGLGPDHDLSGVLGPSDMEDLANFLKYGTFDMTAIASPTTKEAFPGDFVSGQAVYKICTACHGSDGTLINFHDDDEPEYVGTIAVGNPWEFLHKVRSGHPGEAMPGLYGVLTEQQLRDLLTYSQQTLPE